MSLRFHSSKRQSWDLNPDSQIHLPLRESVPQKAQENYFASQSSVEFILNETVTFPYICSK